ncbi:MAG TPA: hypothetical protein DCE42_20875 [Myxococcales bacterium]|nr:hypothetical protein [Deltaproteobacteria bacterium]HAA57233.1 hypothetical protein [Myxococcales bacterium]|tara:strand:- start:164 stop:475 length:312 start_codon:yes stop_codon:yes gene_type:complete
MVHEESSQQQAYTDESITFLQSYLRFCERHVMLFGLALWWEDICEKRHHKNTIIPTKHICINKMYMKSKRKRKKKEKLYERSGTTRGALFVDLPVTQTTTGLL